MAITGRPFFPTLSKFTTTVFNDQKAQESARQKAQELGKAFLAHGQSLHQPPTPEELRKNIELFNKFQAANNKLNALTSNQVTNSYTVKYKPATKVSGGIKALDKAVKQDIKDQDYHNEYSPRN